MRPTKKAEVDYKKNLLVRIRDASMRPQHWTAAAWLLERRYPLEVGKADRRDEQKDEPVQLTLGLELEVMTDDEGGGDSVADDMDGGEDNGGDQG